MSIEQAYQLFSLPNSASINQIEQAYRCIMIENHPDKTVGQSVEIREKKLNISKSATQAVAILRKHIQKDAVSAQRSPHF